MKLFAFVLAIPGIVNAVLPPGHEDDIWCPEGTCQIYTNPYQTVGGSSSYTFCYDPDTETKTDGVWTGSLTNITSPEDYVENPRDCTAVEYSECDTDDDCAFIMDPKCECYSSSHFHPFDPCEGLDASECNTDKCNGDECEVLGCFNEAECWPGSGGRGGTCELSWTDDFMIA